jgi:hypothetical protein
MKANFLLLLTLVTMSLLACKSDQITSKTTETASLPELPQTVQADLNAKCDFVDILLYNVDFSISLNESGSIQGLINSLAAGPATLNNSCQPIGRMFFNAQGKELIAGDLYLNPGVCTYVVFLEKNQRKYASRMSDGAVTMFTNYLNNVKTAPKQ